jgi:hypothetical protein
MRFNAGNMKRLESEAYGNHASHLHVFFFHLIYPFFDLSERIGRYGKILG